MIVKIPAVQEFDLPYSEVERLFDAHLETLTGGAFFKDDGVLYTEDEHYHGSISDSPVENPSEIQLAAVRLQEVRTKQKREREAQRAGRALAESRQQARTAKRSKRS